MIQKSILVLTILGLASPALYLVLGRLSKPLEDLRNAVHAIEHKEYDLPVPGRNRYDEIGALANALDGLREREAELAVLRRANSEKWSVKASESNRLSILPEMLLYSLMKQTK